MRSPSKHTAHVSTSLKLLRRWLCLPCMEHIEPQSQTRPHPKLNLQDSDWLHQNHLCTDFMPSRASPPWHPQNSNYKCWMQKLGHRHPATTPWTYCCPETAPIQAQFPGHQCGSGDLLLGSQNSRRNGTALKARQPGGNREAMPRRNASPPAKTNRGLCGRHWTDFELVKEDARPPWKCGT